MSTPGLLALQQALQAHLLGQPSTIATALRQGHGIATARRLAIYHQAYRARLCETLADSYGHTRDYLGEAWFEREALAYVEVQGSQAFSLRWYGAGFPAWLAQRYSADGEIAELAALDWALRGAFDAADAEALCLADLASLAPADWADLRLRLPPSHARLRLAHNTLALWQALDQGEAPPPAQALERPLELLIWRRGHAPHFRSLGEVERRALEGVTAGLCFAELCADLAEAFPSLDAAAEMGGLLRRWLDEQLLAR